MLDLPILPRFSRPAIAVLALAAMASAQVTGTYTVSGSSCTSGGASVCLSQNDPVPNFNAQNLSNFYAYLAMTGPSAITVTSFEVYTETRTGAAQSVAAALYLSNSGRPDSNPASTGTLNVSGPLGWYTAQLSTPVTIPANTPFYVAHYTGTVRPADAGSAGTTLGTTYYRGGSSLTGSWSSSGLVSSPIYRISCGSGPAPIVSATGIPRINNSFSVDLSNAPAGMPAVLIFGLSTQTYLGAPLPIDLAPIGAPGCQVYVSIDWQGALLTDTNGNASFPTAIPNVPSLAGARFSNQWAAIAPGANTLGLLTSNYGTATIGT